MLVNEIMQDGESVGEFIWRMAKERILTEEYTDQIGLSLAEVMADRMPLKKFFPWKTMISWIVDRTLPEYGMLALRKVLEVTKMIPVDDPAFLIPGIDTPELTEGNA